MSLSNPGCPPESQEKIIHVHYRPPEPELANLELANLDNLSTMNNVNVYEVVPLSSVQLTPVSN